MLPHELGQAASLQWRAPVVWPLAARPVGRHVFFHVPLAWAGARRGPETGACPFCHFFPHPICISAAPAGWALCLSALGHHHFLLALFVQIVRTENTNTQHEQHEPRRRQEQQNKLRKRKKPTHRIVCRRRLVGDQTQSGLSRCGLEFGLAASRSGRGDRLRRDASGSLTEHRAAGLRCHN